MELGRNHPAIPAIAAATAVFDNGRQASISCSIVDLLPPATAPCMDRVAEWASGGNGEEAEVGDVTAEAGDARRGNEEVVAEERREAESGRDRHRS